MDILQAIKRRDSIKTHKYVDLIMNVYIAPKSDKDFDDFKQFFREHDDKIELAKSCSVNQQFRLCAIHESDSSLHVIPNIDKG